MFKRVAQLLTILAMLSGGMMIFGAGSAHAMEMSYSIQPIEMVSGKVLYFDEKFNFIQLDGLTYQRYRQVKVMPNTVFLRNGQPTNVDDIQVGEAITAFGSLNSSGQLVATKVLLGADLMFSRPIGDPIFPIEPTF